MSVRYARVSWSVVVASDDAESMIKGVTAALDELEEKITVYDSGFDQAEAGEPENAAEIAHGN